MVSSLWKDHYGIDVFIISVYNDNSINAFSCFFIVFFPSDIDDVHNDLLHLDIW